MHMIAGRKIYDKQLPQEDWQPVWATHADVPCTEHVLVTQTEQGAGGNEHSGMVGPLLIQD
jgi:hypothetical protein